MKRSTTLGLTILASLLGLFFGATFLKAKPNDEKKEILPQRAGYISMLEIISNFKQWRQANEELQRERDSRSAEMAALLRVVERKKIDLAGATGKEKTEAEKDLIEAQRKLEDADRKHRAYLESFSQKQLALMYTQCQKEIANLAKEYKLDVVYFCPVTPKYLPQGAEDPNKVNLYFQPNALIPVYLNDGMDLTQELLQRLNQKDH